MNLEETLKIAEIMIDNKPENNGNNLASDGVTEVLTSYEVWEKLVEMLSEVCVSERVNFLKACDYEDDRAINDNTPDHD